jgi:serine/threonine-protein kinase HipA
VANLLWGKVYYGEHFAGFLREEPGERASFAYDESYLNAGHPAIAYTLPLQPEPHISHAGLHPFFDNLVAEGWLEEAQMRLLGKRQASRFELLLAFGQDLAGAVSVMDPEPASISDALLEAEDVKEMAVLAGRASLSGIQPKLVAKEVNGVLHPAKIGELSTHIIKFPSRHHDDLVVNEYLTTLAFKKLLPDDNVVDLHVGEIKGFNEQALIIKRFDRDDKGGRIHFEEFNQLLGFKSRAKYDGAYKDIADFINTSKGCLPTESYRVYQRILAGLLLGNTDMHFKNFAMFHTPSGLRLTPSYDQVAAAMYQYKTVALAIYRARDIKIGKLGPTNIIRLGEEFNLKPAAIKMATDGLAKHIEAAKQAISEAELGTPEIKDKLITMLGKRWNGTFALIGKHLSSRQ